jgi:hypothetical protein
VRHAGLVVETLGPALGDDDARPGSGDGGATIAPSAPDQAPNAEAVASSGRTRSSSASSATSGASS